MLTSLTSASVISDATTIFAALLPVVVVALAIGVAFLVARLVPRLVTRGR